MVEKVVRVEWVDSHSKHGWHYSSEEELHLFRCTTIGILDKEDKDSIRVILSVYNDDHDYAHTNMTIPKCSIKSIKRIKI